MNEKKNLKHKKTWEQRVISYLIITKNIHKRNEAWCIIYRNAGVKFQLWRRRLFSQVSVCQYNQSIFTMISIYKNAPQNTINIPIFIITTFCIKD